MAKKLCPFMSQMVWQSNIQEASMHPVYCQGQDCEVWTFVFVTPIEEGAVHRIEGCAFRLGAMTNSEGKVPI